MKYYLKGGNKMGLKNIIKDDFCKCTPKTENTCPICKKKLAYVDSPFGAIPSLVLMEEFYKDIEYEFKKKTENIDKIIYDRLNSVLNREKARFEALIEELQTKIKEQEQLIKAFNEHAEGQLNKKINEFDEQIEEIRNNKEIQLNEVTEKQKKLNFFIQKIYQHFSDTLNFLFGIIKSIFKMTVAFKQAKVEYIDKFSPEIIRLLESLRILDKIMPQLEFHTNDLELPSVEQFFSINQSFITNTQFKEKKAEFERNLAKNILLTTKESTE